MLIGVTPFVVTCLLSMPGQESVNHADGVVYTAHRAFQIPVAISAEDRQSITATRLYVSIDEGKTWKRHSDGSPNLDMVTFRAQKDGPYWFVLTVLDKEGKQDPADVAAADVGLKVVIDSEKPEMILKPVKTRTGKQGVKWQVTDDYPDRSSLKMAVWESGAHEWKIHELTNPDKATEFFDETADVKRIQAYVRDLAGNEVVTQVEIYEDRFASKEVAEFAVDETTDESASANRSIARKVAAPPPAASAVEEPAPIDPPPAVSLPSAEEAVHVASDTPEPTAAVNAPPKTVGLPPRMTSEERMERQLYKSDRVVVNYAADENSSGLVELWGTQDDGEQWTLLAVDVDGQSPIEAKLAGEGLWGLTIQVPATKDDGGKPPKPGAEPDAYVELDSIPPHVEVESMMGDDGTLRIRWLASDKNLEEKPVSIAYSDPSGETWTNVASDLDSSGEYSWNLAKARAEGTLTLRLQAKDEAGNVRAVTADFDVPTPRVATKPKNRVLDVSPK